MNKKHFILHYTFFLIVLLIASFIVVFLYKKSYDYNRSIMPKAIKEIATNKIFTIEEAIGANLLIVITPSGITKLVSFSHPKYAAVFSHFVPFGTFI